MSEKTTTHVEALKELLKSQTTPDQLVKFRAVITTLNDPKAENEIWPQFDRALVRIGNRG